MPQHLAHRRNLADVRPVVVGDVLELAARRRRLLARVVGEGSDQVGRRQRVEERFGLGDDPLPSLLHAGERRRRRRSARGERIEDLARPRFRGRGASSTAARARPCGRPSTRSSSSAGTGCRHPSRRGRPARVAIRSARTAADRHEDGPSVKHSECPDVRSWSTQERRASDEPNRSAAQRPPAGGRDRIRDGRARVRRRRHRRRRATTRDARDRLRQRRGGGRRPPDPRRDRRGTRPTGPGRHARAASIGCIPS